MASPDGGTGFPGQIQARDSVSKAPLDLFADEDSGALKVALYCYDPNDLAWQRMLQPEVDSSGDQDNDVRYYYDGSGNLEYMCVNSVHGAATSATTWVITKFTHGANGITDKEKLTGSVDGRAALGWR